MVSISTKASPRCSNPFGALTSLCLRVRTRHARRHSAATHAARSGVIDAQPPARASPMTIDLDCGSRQAEKRPTRRAGSGTARQEPLMQVNPTDIAVGIFCRIRSTAIRIAMRARTTLIARARNVDPARRVTRPFVRLAGAASYLTCLTFSGLPGTRRSFRRTRSGLSISGIRMRLDVVRRDAVLRPPAAPLRGHAARPRSAGLGPCGERRSVLAGDLGTHLRHDRLRAALPDDTMPMCRLS